MSVLFRILCLLCAAVVTAAPAASAADTNMGHGDAKKIVVARVNGVELNMAQLMKKMREVTEQKYGRRGISPYLANKIKAEALDRLVTEELAYQKASKMIMVPPPEVDAYIEVVRKKHGGEEGLTKFLADEGMTMDDLRRQALRFLTVKKYVEQEIESKITISDDEIRKAYEGAKGKYFMQREGVQVTRITFFLDPGDPKARDKVAQVMRRIHDEADDDPTKLTPDGTFIVQAGIKLDKKRDAALYKVARKLKEYAFSGPIVSNGTLYVVQLTGYQPEIVKTIDEVMPYLRRKLKERRRRALIDQWMKGLRKGAKVEIMDLEA